MQTPTKHISSKHRPSPFPPPLRRLHALNLPQVPNLITPIAFDLRTALVAEGVSIPHDVRRLAIVARKEDDDVAEVLVVFVRVDPD